MARDEYDHLRESADTEAKREGERRAQDITTRPNGTLVDDAAMSRFLLHNLHDGRHVATCAKCRDFVRGGFAR